MASMVLLRLSPRHFTSLLLLLILLLHLTISTLASTSSNYTFPTPFSHLGDSSSTSSSGTSASYTASSNFALSATVILIVGVATGWFVLLIFAKQLKPKYGARVKFNVVTGKAVLREAPLRTLPTSEEARVQQFGASKDFSSDQPPPPSRLGAWAFWCPPCLYNCSCLSWLWCGPRVCCGQPTFGEWLFTFVYRNPTMRWFALFLQIAMLALNVLALVLDVWSRDPSFPVPEGNWELRVGVLKIRSGSIYTADYSCGTASGSDLVQCGTVRVAAGAVFALGLASSLFAFVGVIYSGVLLWQGRSASPAMWLLAQTNFIALTALVLLWPLSPHLILNAIYPANLKLAQSWGIFLISWFLCLVWSWLVKGEVQCTALEESGDRGALAEAAKERQTKMNIDRELAVIETEFEQHNQVLILNQAHLDMEERRAEAANWTKEGYGSQEWQQQKQQQQQAVLSPLQIYARQPHSTGGFLSTRNGVNGAPQVVQRTYHANEPIPAPQVVQPSWQELEVQMWEEKQRLERRRQELQRKRAEQDQISGPFTTSPPRYIDTAALDRARAEREAEQAPAPTDEEMFDLNDNGLQQFQRVYRGGNRGPTSSEYVVYHANAQKPVRIQRDPNSLDATFQRAPLENQAPPLWKTTPANNAGAGAGTAPGPMTPSIAATPNPKTPNSKKKKKKQLTVEVDEEVVDDVPVPLPADLSQFRVLPAAYVKDSLQMDAAELDHLAKMRRIKKKKTMVVETEDDEDEDEVGVEGAKQEEGKGGQLPGSSAESIIMPATQSQPVTPAQYRAIIKAEHESAPNLLQPPEPKYDFPSASFHQQQLQPFGRLPPIQSTLSPHPSTLNRSYAPPPPPMPLFPGQPMSPVRPQARVYLYTADPSVSRLPRQQPSFTSDFHFASTFSQQQPFGQTQPINFERTFSQTSSSQPPSILSPSRQQQQQPLPRTPSQTRFTLNQSSMSPHAPHHPNLHVDVPDPDLTRTGTLPTPSMNVSYDPYVNQANNPLGNTQGSGGADGFAVHPTAFASGDEVDSDDEVIAPVRRVPLTPMTPRLIDGPQSAAILRQTPRQQQQMQPPYGPMMSMPTYPTNMSPSGPYSYQFR